MKKEVTGTLLMLLVCSCAGGTLLAALWVIFRTIGE